MKKNAFTLIELLAVIVILAIIALIAVPIVIHIIDDTKTSSEKESVELYIDSVKKAVARKQLEKNNFNPATCEIKEDGNLLCDDVEVIVEMKGAKPINGIIELENGKIIEETMWLQMSNNDFYSYKKSIIMKLTENEIKQLQSGLPRKYQEVEYIESTGTQYIDTGISYQEGNPQHKQIEINCAVISGSGTIWGVANIPDRNRLLLYTDTNWKFITHTGNVGTKYTDTEIVVNNNKINIKLIENYLYIDNVKFGIGGLNAIIKYTSNKTISIFGKHDNNGYTSFNGNLRIYSFIIKSGDGSSLIRNLIPCYSKTTVIDVDGIERPKGTVGMYDLVEGKFYTNQGTGEFIKGPDV